MSQLSVDKVLREGGEKTDEQKLLSDGRNCDRKQAERFSFKIMFIIINYCIHSCIHSVNIS